MFSVERMPFGSSCFLFLLTHSHNRMPFGSSCFFVFTHTLPQQDAFWLLMFFSVLTEQDALGSSQNRMPLAPHVVVLVELPNVNFCSKNTEYGKQLSATQVCNCAKSVFFASFEMGSNASTPPAPASNRLSDEDLQELVGRLVSFLPAPVAPPQNAVPVPVIGAAPVPPATPGGPQAPLPPPPGPPPDASTQEILLCLLPHQHHQMAPLQLLQLIQQCLAMRMILERMSECVRCADICLISAMEYVSTRIV